MVLYLVLRLLSPSLLSFEVIYIIEELSLLLLFLLDVFSYFMYPLFL